MPIRQHDDLPIRGVPRIRTRVLVDGESGAVATSGWEQWMAADGFIPPHYHDVEEIDNLVASMLNYARLDHPDIEMHWQDVPVEAWLRQVVAKAPADLSRIETRTGNAPDKVPLDPTLMELALSNLLVNATKYADGSVRCELTQSGDDYELRVEDDGAGIPESERESVFKAFTRIDDSRNRETGGYGLGLAIVARVAELHGGEAHVDRSPDLNGARFVIRWPLSQNGQ